MVWIFIWKCWNVTSQLTEGGDDAEHSFLSLRLAPWQGGRHHLLQPAGGLPFCKGAHGELSSSALLSSSKTWAPRPGRQLDSQKRWADKGVPRVPSIHPRWAAKGKAVPLIWSRRGSRLSGPRNQTLLHFHNSLLSEKQLIHPRKTSKRWILELIVVKPLCPNLPWFLLL